MKKFEYDFLGYYRKMIRLPLSLSLITVVTLALPWRSDWIILLLIIYTGLLYRTGSLAIRLIITPARSLPILAFPYDHPGFPHCLKPLKRQKNRTEPIQTGLHTYPPTAVLNWP